MGDCSPLCITITVPHPRVFKQIVFQSSNQNICTCSGGYGVAVPYPSVARSVERLKWRDGLGGEEGGLARKCCFQDNPKIFLNSCILTTLTIGNSRPFKTLKSLSLVTK